MNFEQCFKGGDCQTIKFNPAPNSDGKLGIASGSAMLGPPTSKMIGEHLDGETALAVALKDVVCFDVDPVEPKSFDAKTWHRENAEAIHDAHLIATYSKSSDPSKGYGGLRLWRHRGDMLIKDALAWSKHIRNSLTTDGVKEIEIFPKGDKPIMLPYFGDKCGMLNGEKASKFAETITREMLIADDVSLTTSLDLSVGRHDRLVSMGSSMLARGEKIEIVSVAIDALFWQEQENRPAESRADAQKEIDGILANLKRKDIGIASGFTKLVEFTPELRTSKSDIEYEITYNGKRCRVAGFNRLDDYRFMRCAIAEQCGELITLSRNEWQGKLTELWPERAFASIDDTRESVVLRACLNIVRKSFMKLSVPPATDGTRLGSGEADAWLEEKSRRIWFKGDLMTSAINSNNQGYKISVVELREIVEACGGGKLEKRVPGHRKVRLMWLPCPDEEFDELLRAVENDERPLLERDYHDRRNRRMTEPSDGRLESAKREISERAFGRPY